MSQILLHTNDLIDRCKTGDSRAQMALYEQYCKAMYNVAYRIVKDHAEAEDVMQESFIKAFSKLSDFRGEVSFGAWLKRIVINTGIQSYRKQQRSQEVPLEAVLYRVEDKEDSSPDYETVDQKAQKVLQLISMLKENYRLALTLHLVEGLDYEETASMLNISNGNCRTLISRAKEQLRMRLSETGLA